MYARYRPAGLLLLIAFLTIGCDGDATSRPQALEAYLEGTVVGAEGEPLDGAFVALNFTVESSNASDESPAPFRVGLMANWQKPQGLRIEILDVQRRLVRSLHQGLLPPGPRIVEWDGLDEAQEPAPDGIYILAETPDPSLSDYPSTFDQLIRLTGDRPRLLIGSSLATTDAEGRFRFVMPLTAFPSGGSLQGVYLDGRSLDDFAVAASVDVIALVDEGGSVRTTGRTVPIVDQSQTIAVELVIPGPY